MPPSYQGYRLSSYPDLPGEAHGRWTRNNGDARIGLGENFWGYRGRGRTGRYANAEDVDVKAYEEGIVLPSSYPVDGDGYRDGDIDGDGFGNKNNGWGGRNHP